MNNATTNVLEQATASVADFAEGAAAADSAAILFAAGAAINAQQESLVNSDEAVIVVPEGYQVHTERAPNRPNIQKGNAQFVSAESFCHYTNKHKRPNTMIYASVNKQPKFVAVYDDHRAFNNEIYEIVEGNDGDYSGLFAEHQNFRATLNLEWSQEWKTWKAYNREPMNQLAFATFIEDNIDDVIEPAGADMLTTILDFKTSSEGRFNTKANLHNGSVDFVYTDTVTQATGTLTMPTQITINIPIIKHAAPQPVTARLKYRVKDGALAIWYEIIRVHKIEDDAVSATALLIMQQTEVPVLFGTVD